ncbi:MAG: argininosuccinate lyase [Rhodobacteraceae bacterium]|nr:MAG: argininosuccinate lyase [Paracoccaceae bacterium]
MMRILAVMIAGAVLMSCGVKGDPLPPKTQKTTNLTVSGTVDVGITKKI